MDITKLNHSKMPRLDCRACPQPPPYFPNSIATHPCVQGLPWQPIHDTVCSCTGVCLRRCCSSRAQPPRGDTATQEPVHTQARRERLFLTQCFAGKGLPSGAKPQASSRAWKALIAPSRILRRDTQQTKQPKPHQGSQRTVKLSAL